SDPWHPSGDWISDDLLDAQSAWRIIQRLPESQLDAVVAEKEQVVHRLSHLRAGLQHVSPSHGSGDRAPSGGGGGAGAGGGATLEHLVNTLTYGESLAESLRDL